ncbi:phage portal protein [Mycolicibacterium septicum DSM 44393]|uniref:Phage portal protein n=1 Tax=Mycolicibacterium septicum DSM 44393 TaxID=1341646 RepID=A0A7X6RXP1_9MYCO|nr:phage portal protein [Mycolicibacterium septicum]NKZ13659.1 phage portal protein [Mycolicibacterium septicum DSM 44393]
MTDDLIELLQALDAPQYRYRVLDNYFNGNSPLSFLSPEAKVALRNFDQLSSNLCRTAVVSLQERLRLSGVEGTDAWSLFEYSDLDQLAAQVHRDALLYGVGYVLVWTDSNGKPRATVESPKQVIAQRDPVTRDVVKAVKRVRTKTTTEAWVYYPDRVEHWRSNSPSSGNAGYALVETVPHTLGVVPVVPIGDDSSAIDDLLSLQDGINKLLTDMLIASEYAGRPRRYATGIELVEKPVTDDQGQPVIDPDTGEVVTEAVNPFPESNRMMVSEAAESKFGALPAADLKTFESGIRVLISQAMMVSGLPAHYVGLLQESVTSADALRAAEAALVARAEARQRIYGVGWEAVARLLVAIRDGVDPDSVIARVVWSPADTRSQAQEADYAVKLYSAGILSRKGVLKRLGLTADEVEEELANTREEAQVGHDLKFAAFSRDLDTMTGKPPQKPAA